MTIRGICAEEQLLKVHVGKNWTAMIGNIYSLHAADKFLYTITLPEIATCGTENGIQQYTNVCLVFL